MAMLQLVFVALMSVSMVTTGSDTYHLTVYRSGCTNQITLKCNTPAVYTTFWRALSLESNIWEVVATGMEYKFEITPSTEGAYYCGESQTSASTGKELLAFPTRMPGTQDFYAVPVGTQFTAMDCGIEQGVLSEKYTHRYWNKGITPIGGTDPRVAVHYNNLSLVVKDAQLDDGGTYECFIEVNAGCTATQKVALLSYSHPKITPMGQSTVAVQIGEQKDTTFTCSMAAQTGKDTIQSVNVSWWHNGKEIVDGEGEKYSTVHNNSDPTEHRLQVKSTLKIHDLNLEDSGPVKCEVTLTALTAEDRREEVVLVSTMTTQLFVISNGLNVAVEDVIGPHTEVCITNLPMPLPNTDNLKLYIKLTEVDEATSQPKPDSYVELPSSYGSLKFLTDTKVCYTYTLHEKDLKGKIKSKYARIQVALKIGDVMGPYVPPLWDATELDLHPDATAPSPKTPTHSPETIKHYIGMAAGALILATVAVAVLVTVRCIVRSRRSHKRQHCCESQTDMN